MSHRTDKIGLCSRETLENTMKHHKIQQLCRNGHQMTTVHNVFLLLLLSFCFLAEKSTNVHVL